MGGNDQSKLTVGEGFPADEIDKSGCDIDLLLSRLFVRNILKKVQKKKLTIKY